MIANGVSFPEDELPRPKRGHADLLQRADLLLAHHRHRGQHHGDEHQHHGEHRGDIEPAGLQIGVVEDARHDFDPADRRGPGQGRAQASGGFGASPIQGVEAGLLERSAHLGDDPRGVAETDHRGVGVGSVGEDLKPGRSSRGQFVAVPLGDHQDDLGQAFDQPRLRLFGGRDRALDLEIARSVEPLDQGAARHTAIAVDQEQGDVGHVEIRRVAEGDELDQRSDDQRGDDLAILPELQELLEDDLKQGSHET